MPTAASAPDPIHERLDALEGRMERLESGIDRLLALVDQAPDTLAMVTDTADDYVAQAAQRGIDVEERLMGLVDAMERLTEPKTLDALLRLAESAEGMGTAMHLASKLDDHLAMAADFFDTWAVEQANRGVDIEDRIRVLGEALEALTEPRAVEALTLLVRHSDTLFKTGILADDTVTVLGNIGSALPRAVGQAPAPLGFWGLMQALRRPEVQRAAGLGVAIAAEVGASLQQPSSLLTKH